MRRADLTILLLLGLGLLAAILIVVGSLQEEPTLSALAGALVAAVVLFSLALVHRDLRRARADLRGLAQQNRDLRRTMKAGLKGAAATSSADHEAVVAQMRSQVDAALEHDRTALRDLVSTDSARLAERLHADLEAAGQTSVERTELALTEAAREFTAQTQAALSLSARHRTLAPVRRPGPTGATARQVLEMLEVMQHTAARSTIGFGLADVTVWAGYEAAACGSRLTAVVADEAGVTAAEHQVAEHQLTGSVTVCRAPVEPVSVEHVYQPWHNLCAVPDDLGDFDLVLAVLGPDGPRTLLPALALLTGRLMPGAAVALATGPTPDTRQLIGVWQTNHGARLDTTLSSADVTVVRLP